MTFDEVATEVRPSASDSGRDAGQDGGQDAARDSGRDSGQDAGGGPAANSSPEALSDQDLDMLARRLYGRIRDRLGTELLLDRERAGLLADL